MNFDWSFFWHYLVQPSSVYLHGLWLTLSLSVISQCLGTLIGVANYPGCQRRSQFAGFARFGFAKSQHRFIYGVRLVLLTDERGLPLGYTIVPANEKEYEPLADLLTGIKNYHVAVKEAGNRIVFLRTVEAGPADRSYGIEVAKLAGIPSTVTQRAREILKRHEENEHQLSDNLTVRARRKPKVVINQLALFTALEEELRNSLRSVDLDNLTPLEALRLLAELKKKAE